MTQNSSKKVLSGKLSLAGRHMTQATAIEITPTGKAFHYGITVRFHLKEPMQLDVATISSGLFDLKYESSMMQFPMYFDAEYLDLGLEENGSGCVISLFFKATTKQPPIAVPPPKKIILSV